MLETMYLFELSLLFTLPFKDNFLMSLSVWNLNKGFLSSKATISLKLNWRDFEYGFRRKNSIDDSLRVFVFCLDSRRYYIYTE